MKLFPHRLRALSLVLLGPALAPGAGAGDEGPKQAGWGVVVVQVAAGSPAEKAGLQAGDVLLAWSRAGAQGEIRTVFDSMDVESDQSPRGAVDLSGVRDGKPFKVTIASAGWRIRARPRLTQRLLELNDRGQASIDAKDVDAGVTAWTEAGSEARKAEDAVSAFWFYLKSGEALRAARRPAEAVQVQEEAFAAARASGSLALLARAWTTRGGALEEKQDLPGAEAAYRESARSWEQARPDSLLLATAWQNVGVIADRRSDYPASEEAHRKALALRDRLAPESPEAAMSWTQLGNVAMARHDLVRAEQLQRRALEIREKAVPGSLGVAWSLGNLGLIARRRGDLAGAEDNLRRAQEILERLGQKDDVARALNNRGVIALERGDLASAEDLTRRGLAIRDEVAPDSLDVASSLTNLGVVALERGELDEGEALEQRALSIRQKIAPQSLGVAEALNNLGNVALQKGDLALSARHRREALALWEKQVPDTLHVADGLVSLATVLRAQGDLEVAAEHVDRALALHERIAPGSVNHGEALNVSGLIRLEQGDLAAARSRYGRALEIHARLAPGSADEAESLRGLGRADRKANLTQAAEELCRAVDSIDRQRTKLGGREESRSALSASYGEYYRDCLEVLVDLGRAGEAFGVLERSKARELLTLLAERDLLYASDVPEDVGREASRIDREYDRVQAEMAGLNPQKDGEQVQRILGRLRELRAEAEQMRAKIVRLSPRLASLRYPEPLDPAAARAVLDPGTVLLSYSIGRHRSFLFVLTAEGPDVSVHEIKVGDEGLRKRVDAFRAAIADPAARGTRYVQEAKALFSDLVEPAAASIEAGQRVLISPDGPLHLLPFAALMRARGPSPSFFVEWRPLHGVLSATVYAEIKKNRGTGSAATKTLVAFGDPAYPKVAGLAEGLGDRDLRAVVRRGWALTPLPATRAEVEAIARLYPDRSHVYVGEAATEERAKSVGKDVGYLHFACHGVLDSDVPLNSGLALTIRGDSGAERDNGFLQAWEIFEKVRLDAELVTLSACETGLGRQMGGEGLMGLTRAFLYAGARSVMASLWKISDQSTAELMRRFYGHLAAGKPKDDALRRAQIDLIRGAVWSGGPSTRGVGGLATRAKGPSSHPFYWAAFQLVGDWH